jgi:hypothetical protein
MRDTAPFTTDASLAGSADAGSFTERMRDASVGSVFDACSMSFIARSISRGEPRRRSEFESLSTATVTPSPADVASDDAAPAAASACAGGSCAAFGGSTCAKASCTNASRAGSAGGQPGPRMPGCPFAGTASSSIVLLCELPAGLGAS